MDLDAHKKPPDALRHVFKHYQKASQQDLEVDPEVFDFKRGLNESQHGKLKRISWHTNYELRNAFVTFAGEEYTDNVALLAEINEFKVHAYKHNELSDLTIIPSCIPMKIQQLLLSRLLHRDLANPKHKTNVHFHHDLPYPNADQSFFDIEHPEAVFVEPRNADIHRPMTMEQVLNKKLRWMTLGGQYDWTGKKYPEGDPPDFPCDIQNLLRSLFPETIAQAAIVNLYSPGDVLSLHRDVSEECDRGIISLSLGCDGIFVIGMEQESTSESVKYVVLRLRSGDAIYMSGSARFAYHGIPSVIAGTCPDELSNWPAAAPDSLDVESSEQHYQRWAGWMAMKRINLNVRQIWDRSDAPSEAQPHPRPEQE